MFAKKSAVNTTQNTFGVLMLTINDRRTTEQQTTHIYLALVTDKSMSGWGQAEGGNSYAAWAFENLEAADKMVAQLEMSKRYQRPRIVICRPGNRFRPGKHCTHLSIYVG
jgi:hypothetical protein